LSEMMVVDLLNAAYWYTMFSMYHFHSQWNEGLGISQFSLNNEFKRYPRTCTQQLVWTRICNQLCSCCESVKIHYIEPYSYNLGEPNLYYPVSWKINIILIERWTTQLWSFKQFFMLCQSFRNGWVKWYPIVKKL
jgi:hypothetical protein